MTGSFAVAYCGPAPAPPDLATAWNLDPVLLAVLAAAAVILAGRSERSIAGWAALAVLAVAFVSPLCALSSALFSARVAHHLLLVAVAAPLAALAFPTRRPSGTPAVWFVAHALALWVWHAPGPYDWALGSVPGYWLMQATLLSTAFGLWRAILSAGLVASLALLVGTAAQMGLLAALIVFAPGVLHVAHLTSTAPWGLEPLVDQQLAGLLMWVPGIVPYLCVGLWRVSRLASAARIAG
jgi:putative membrane protein